MARKGLAKLFAETRIPCHVTGVGSIFLTHFGKTVVLDASDAAKSDRALLFFLPTKMAALSFAHEESDIKNLLEATEKIIVDSKLFKQQHS